MAITITGRNMNFTDARQTISFQRGETKMSCFMTMIDYYLLGARVSFCVCKNSCHVVQKLPCCLSGSSLSSDIATQVTCIVIAQCSSKFSSSDVVTCFLLSGGLVFLFPPTRFLSSPSPFSTRVCQGQVPPDKCPPSLQVKSLLKFSLQGI